SIYVDGARAVTVDRLAPFVWDPATGSVTFTGGATGTVSYNRAVAGMKAPQQVVHTDPQVIDELAKAGVDITADLTNLAQGATVSASYTASGSGTAAAVDGFPINEPFWGAATGAAPSRRR
ncbi:MAG: hypothetical protein IRZ07_11195, partial [Microbispora sp.]|nr:hypothetical protein [Microbispora sp.]